jgi:hypothetical protein
MGSARSFTLMLVSIASIALPAAAGELCIGPDLYDQCVSLDCDPLNPQVHEPARIGYSEEGPGPACQVGYCGPVGDSAEYGWSISRSSTDPKVNTGVLPAGQSSLYLWCYCVHPALGLLAAEMGFSGSLNVVAFHAIDCDVVGNATNIILRTECVIQGKVLGEIVVDKPLPVTPSRWGEIKSRYR